MTENYKKNAENLTKIIAQTTFIFATGSFYLGIVNIQPASASTSCSVVGVRSVPGRLETRETFRATGANRSACNSEIDNSVSRWCNWFPIVEGARCYQDMSTWIISSNDRPRPNPSPAPDPNTVTSSYSRFRLQTRTALHETGGNFAFSVLRNGDLVAIKKSGTGTGKTEVHILSAASNYQSFRFQTGTALEQTGDNWNFGVLPNDDLVAIKSGTGTVKTEVHILTAQ